MNAAHTIPNTYRAVVAFFPAGGEMVLTAPADADKDDAEMMRLARIEAKYACIDVDSADLRITEWTDC